MSNIRAANSLEPDFISSLRALSPSFVLSEGMITRYLSAYYRAP